MNCFNVGAAQQGGTATEDHHEEIVMKRDTYEIWYHMHGSSWDAEVHTCVKTEIVGDDMESVRKQFLDENPGATIYSIDVA